MQHRFYYFFAVCFIAVACHSASSPVKITNKQRSAIYDSITENGPAVMWLQQDTIDATVVNSYFCDHDMYRMPDDEKHKWAITTACALLRHLGKGNGLKKGCFYFMDYEEGKDEDFAHAIPIDMKLDSMTKVLF